MTLLPPCLPSPNRPHPFLNWSTSYPFSLKLLLVRYLVTETRKATESGSIHTKGLPYGRAPWACYCREGEWRPFTVEQKHLHPTTSSIKFWYLIVFATEDFQAKAHYRSDRSLLCSSGNSSQLQITSMLCQRLLMHHDQHAPSPHNPARQAITASQFRQGESKVHSNLQGRSCCCFLKQVLNSGLYPALWWLKMPLLHLSKLDTKGKRAALTLIWRTLSMRFPWKYILSWFIYF